MTVHTKYLTGLVALGLALTACTSSSGNGNGTTPTPTQGASTGGAPTFPLASSPPASSTPPSSPAQSSAPVGGSVPSKATLQGILLKQAEVPAGYTSVTPSPDSSDDASSAQQLIACVGGISANPQQDKVDKVESEFSNPQHASLSSDATSYKSQDDVDALVSVIKSPKADTCFNELIKKELQTSVPSGTKIGNLSVHLTPGSSGGPSNVVGTANASVTIASGQGQSITVHLVSVFISGKQLAASVDAETLGGPIDTTALGKAVLAVAGRAASA